MTESTKCPQCGGELSANFPPGVCPACLLRQGMSPSTLTGAEGEVSGASGSSPRRSWTPPTPAELAPKFPQLEIVELLGQGGMGAVYKVRQKDLDRWAALKILPGDVANDPNFAERFQREARALAQLSHQHIVTVYEFGQRDGVYFLLMEYVDGVTLRQAIRVGTTGNPVSGRALAAGFVQSPAASALPLTGNDPGFASPSHSSLTATISAPQALGIVTQICDALQFAHEEGVVHRDIKPENILIDKRGRVKIADFGLAKLLGKQASFPTLTGTHQIMGTPVYMAPEQMEGSRSIDHRADIFSLGVVFYELLTGELPLGRFAPPSQKYSLDVRLDEIVLRTLEKEPDRRYQQASEVKLDVETIRSQPVAAGPAKTVKPRRSWSVGKSIVRTLIIAMGTFSGLVGTVFFISWLDQQSRPSEAHRAPTPTASQKAAAIEHYVTEVERQRLDQQRQKQLEEESRDPLEVNAIVQFTADGVKLHPQFGLNELNSEQRLAIERIMNARHQEYLLYESRVAKREPTKNGVQIVTISNLDTETSTLENDFWTDIDSALPVAQQKFLRLNLPLYQDQHSDRARHFLIDAPQVGMGGGSPGMMSGGGLSAMSATPGGLAIDSSILRYQQLLGWNRGYLPLQIAITRRGKWFAWSLCQARVDRVSGPDGTIRETYVPQLELDRGEAPELPSGLRRFWQEPPSPNAGGQRLDTHAAGLDLQPPESTDAESNDTIVWLKTGELRLSHWFAKTIRLEGEKLDKVNSLITETWKKYMALEAKHTQYSTTPEAEYVAVISAFPIERRQLENEFWEQLDDLVDGPVNEALHVSKFTVHQLNSVSPGLFGWRDHLDKVQVTIWKKGNWFHWRTRNKRDSDGLTWGRGEGDGASLPSELAHYWKARNVSAGREVPADGDAADNAQSAKNPYDSPEDAFQRAKQAYAARQWHNFADCFTEDARNETVILVLLTQVAEPEDAELKRLFDLLETTYPMLKLSSAELHPKLRAFIHKTRRSTRTECRTTASELIRATFGEQTRDVFERISEESIPEDRINFGELRIQSTGNGDAFGYYGHDAVVTTKAEEGLPIWFKWQDREWKIDGMFDLKSLIKEMFPPDRKLTGTSADPIEALIPPLDAQLRELDALRAADKTPWDEVEKRANELLAKYTAPADKGRIHWMAAHVYGQSDIRGHGADVIRHAQEALKYERDPIQRGWLFMYLGNAAEVADSEPKNFVARRAEATRWYLKGYRELLPFNLPVRASELPPVFKIGDGFRGGPEGEVDPEQVAAEVQHAAQMKARKDAEFTYELVSRRNVYIARLQDLYGRMHELYDKDAVAKGRLREIAAEMFRDEAIVADVLNRVWPPDSNEVPTAPD